MYTQLYYWHTFTNLYFITDLLSILQVKKHIDGLVTFQVSKPNLNLLTLMREKDAVNKCSPTNTMAQIMLSWAFCNNKT